MLDREVIRKARDVLRQHRDQLIGAIAWHGIERLETIHHLAFVQLAIAACVSSAEDAARPSKTARRGRASAKTCRKIGGVTRKFQASPPVRSQA